MLIVSALGSLAAVRAAADAFDRLDPSPATAVSWFEEDHGRFRLEAYADTDQDAEAAQAVIAHAVPDLSAQIAPVPDADWVAMALGGLPAVRAGRFVIGGAHALGGQRGGRVRLWIEASEAFGTGHHATTRGCLLLFERLLRQGVRPRRVLDVGAGSGVLAIAAARCGARALAVELEARAAEIAAVNVRRNAVSVQVRAGDGARVAAAAGRTHDLVFANILLKPLVRMAPALAGTLAPGGRLIASGVLARQAGTLRRALEGQGLIFDAAIRQHGWAALSFRRPTQR